MVGTIICTRSPTQQNSRIRALSSSAPRFALRRPGRRDFFGPRAAPIRLNSVHQTGICRVRANTPDQLSYQALFRHSQQLGYAWPLPPDSPSARLRLLVTVPPQAPRGPPWRDVQHRASLGRAPGTAASPHVRSVRSCVVSPAGSPSCVPAEDRLPNPPLDCCHNLSICAAHASGVPIAPSPEPLMNSIISPTELPTTAICGNAATCWN